MKFLYTEKGLRNYTKTTGVPKALMQYDIMNDEVLNELDPYQKTVMRLRANNRIVNQYGDSDMYRNFSTMFVYSVSGPGYAPIVGTTEFSSILMVFNKKPTENAWTMFTLTGQTDGTWAEKLDQLK
jgi:hypothetical protein